MIAKPPPPRGVVRTAGGDDGPEPRAVPEHPEMGELVDYHGLEGFGRGEDEPPREGEATLLRGTPPTAALVADADRGRSHVERGCMKPDLALDLAAGTGPEPRFQHGRR